jgi:CheY-like chemotaxis protein
MVPMSKIEWISLKQAIDISDLSDKTIRRKIKTKQYRSKYVKGKYGRELRVAKEDVFKDVQTLKTPGQGVVTSEKSKGFGDTPGQPETLNEEGSGREQPANIVPLKPPAQPLRVVLADDSEEMATYLHRQLQKLKVEIAGTAKDGISALELVEVERPDLVIAEMALPGMDGFQLAQEKDKRKEIHQTPLVFLSYVKEHAIVQEARQLPGVVAYFGKPLISTELARFKTWIQEVKKDICGQAIGVVRNCA